MSPENSHRPASFRTISVVGVVVVGAIFAGMAAIGCWHTLARLVPIEEQPVTLVNWERLEGGMSPVRGSVGGKSAFFDLQDRTGEVDRIAVPPVAWQARQQLSLSKDLRLERSRLGGLPSALADYGKPTTALVPSGGVVEKLLRNAERSESAEEPPTRFPLLIPIVGSIGAMVLGLAVWAFLAIRLWLNRSLTAGQSLEKIALVIGSVMGVVGSIVWFG